MKRGCDVTAIDDKRRQLPFLGNPVDEGGGSGEMDLGDGRGRARDYENGSIYFTPQTGAHEVHGGIRLKWAQLRGHRGLLGYPTTDETGCPDGRGRFNHFEHGSIYWTPQTGAFEVHGLIRELWASLGFERSNLRYPVSDEMDAPGGRLSRFEGGEIRWTPTGGAQASFSSGFGDDFEGVPVDD
jgi:uncharacterized protein with LGFP repeats